MAKTRRESIMIFLLLLNTCISQVIYGNDTMSDFKALCSSEYGNVDLDYQLENLIVITRNGDRSPKNNKRSSWNKRMCIKCPKNRCILHPCDEELLTIKGYHQGHILANFIKSQYLPKFSTDLKAKTSAISTNENFISWNTKNKDDTDRSESKLAITKFQANYLPSISGYFYKNSKNHTFLNSIVESLNYSKLSYNQIKSITCNDNCLEMKNLFSNMNEPKNEEKTNMFEKILSSLCTDVPINCDSFNCDLEKMEEFLIHEKLDFEDNLAKMRENFIAVAIDFNKMATFLLKLINDPNDIKIVSADSKTLVTALAGLFTSNQKLVPYGAAIFLESWKNKNQEEFFGLLYNGRRMKFGLYKESFIKKSEFIKFLTMFSQFEKPINNIYNQKIKEINEQSFLEFKKKEIENILEPLSKLLQQNRVLSRY